MISFLDSSFVLKLYIPEADSEEAASIFDGLAGSASVNSLTDLEVASVIHRRLSATEAPQVYGTYREHRIRGVSRYTEVGESTFRLACELVERYGGRFFLRSLDAIHLAAALQAGSDQFVTLDKGLAKAANAAGLKVLPTGS